MAVVRSQREMNTEKEVSPKRHGDSDEGYVRRWKLHDHEERKSGKGERKKGEEEPEAWTVRLA